MTDESEKRTRKEITFVVEPGSYEDWEGFLATRKVDRERGATFHGNGETELDAIEDAVKTLRAIEEQ